MLPNFGVLSNLASGSNTSAIFIDILYSRPVIDITIERMKSMEKHSKLNWESLRMGFKNKVNAEKNKMNPSPIIIISVTDRDPVMAADLANASVYALNNRLQELSIIEAAQKRVLLEKQLEEVRKNLIKSEEAFVEFQEKTGIVEVEGQLNITIDKFTPALTLDYKRIFRNLKFHESLYKITLNQYETTKIAESKAPSAMKVIEAAIPPEKPYNKGRKRLIVIATALGLIFSVFGAFFMEYVNKTSNRGSNTEKMEAFRKYMSFKKTG